MLQRIGFMQGRLSSPIDGQVQAFPWSSWQLEFPLAKDRGFGQMEWTLDQDRLYENPIMTSGGQSDINNLCQEYGISIPSVTGDCFMQTPFWKAEGARRAGLEKDLHAVFETTGKARVKLIVIPLVDNGRLDSRQQEDDLLNYLKGQIDLLKKYTLKVLFESDYPPYELARFIDQFDSTYFGVNYDIGNSAALGYDPEEEIARYGQRIGNVHVKDRVLGGCTVPLGTGNACFEKVFSALAKVGYRGNYILQTARAANGDHTGALCRYRDMTADWINRYAA